MHYHYYYYYYVHYYYYYYYYHYYYYLRALPRRTATVRFEARESDIRTKGDKHMHVLMHNMYA